MRLPKRLHLKSPKQFAHIKETGSVSSGKFLLVSAAPLPDLPDFLFGLVTSKKVGDAVTRNRIRRRLREIIRLQRPLLKPHYQWVIVAKWRCSQASSIELTKEFRYHAKKLKFLSSSPDAPSSL
jgi:ribonuclease P protein component